MIWHLVEVWMLVVLTFVVGCLAGAHLYGLIAGSRFAIAQGIVADAVGDAVDRMKARVGLAPAWRPVHLRQVERAWPAEHEEPADDLPEIEIPVDEGVVHAPIHSGEVAAIAADRTHRSPHPNRPLSHRRATLPPRPAVAAIAAPAAPKRPAGLSVPRGGVPDNLQRIKGIGRRNEELLNRLGIFHFGQIAAWTPSEVMWVGQYLVFPERISRDDWLGQATVLAMGAETGFQKSAERRRERRRSERAFEARMATASASHDESGARDSESEHPPKPSGVAGDVDLPALDGDGALVGDDGAAEADVPAEESDSEKDRLTALADDEEPDAPR